jgi:hypothetical protein
MKEAWGASFNHNFNLLEWIMKWSFQKMPIIRLPRDAEIPLEPYYPFWPIGKMLSIPF